MRWFNIEVLFVVWEISFFSGDVVQCLLNEALYLFLQSSVCHVRIFVTQYLLKFNIQKAHFMLISAN